MENCISFHENFNIAKQEKLTYKPIKSAFCLNEREENHFHNKADIGCQLYVI